MQNDKLVYKLYILVLFGIIFGKEKEALILSSEEYKNNVNGALYLTFVDGP